MTIVIFVFALFAIPILCIVGDVNSDNQVAKVASPPVLMASSFQHYFRTIFNPNGHDN